MPAHVVAHSDVTDPTPFGRHAAQVTAIVELPSRDDALRRQRSPEHGEPIPLGWAAGPSALVLTPQAD